jgi:hypothetical protein
MPQLEFECLKVISEFVMPHLDDKQLAEMMSNRSIKHRPVVFGSVLGADVSGLVDDVLCPDAKQEMVEAARRYSKAIDDMQASALAKRGAVKPVGGSKKKKKMGEKDLQFVEMSRKYLPLQSEGGCNLTNEVDWHTRFKIEYPTWTPPHGTSASYDEKIQGSKRQAMIFCVTWAWSHHERQTGEVCPYDLGS